MGSVGFGWVLFRVPWCTWWDSEPWRKGPETAVISTSHNQIPLLLRAFFVDPRGRNLGGTEMWLCYDIYIKRPSSTP